MFSSSHMHKLVLQISLDVALICKIFVASMRTGKGGRLILKVGIYVQSSSLISIKNRKSKTSSFKK